MRYTSSNAALAIIPSETPIDQAWEEESDDWKRALAESLIERIVVAKGNTKPYYSIDGAMARFDPSLVVIEWRSFQ